MTLIELLDLLKRRRMCHSDAHLARLLGVTPSTLSHYKSGTRRPSLAHCDEIARLLQLDPDLVVSMARGHPSVVPARQLELEEQLLHS